MQHEGFDEVNLYNDIGLIILNEEVQLNSYIQIACLPPISTFYPSAFVPAYAAGWGTLASGGIAPNLLNNVKLTVYPSSYCYNVNQYLNTNSQICAGEMAGILIIILTTYAT